MQSFTSSSDEQEHGPPTAPGRAGSALSGIDYEWMANCAHVISICHPSFGYISTDWTKFLRRSAYEVTKHEAGDALRQRIKRGRLELEFLTMRLAETATGKALHKKQKTAEMNARYVLKNGARVYVGKKETEATKKRKAAAARERRARKRATSHGDIPATDDAFWHENQCIAAAAEAKVLVTRSKRIQL